MQSAIENGPRRILALDGGGVRGVIELAFLERIEALLKERSANPLDFRLCDYFDLIGGTSTGAIIAAGLATGRRVEEVKSLYAELAPRVFRKPWWRLTGLQSRFAAKPLAELLNRELPGFTLDDERIRTYLALVAKRMDTGSPWIVSNIPSQPYWDDPADGSHRGNRHYSLPQLIRASTAAPYYFGPERVPIETGAISGVFVDGGVTPYNNPSIPLLMLATMGPFGLRWKLARDNLLFISIGTGSFRARISPRDIELKPAGKFALDTLLGLVGDCQVASNTLMQWLSYSPDPWIINSEIGDLREEYLAGVPMLTYQRYDIWMERDWLRTNLGLNASDKDVARLRRMDDPANMPELFRLGREAAATQVQPQHLEAMFDRPEGADRLR